MAFKAKVVLDSVGPNRRRLISVEATYPRFIHAEIMTHRDRARNAASSRAIPWKRKGKQAVPISEMPKGAVPIGRGIHSEITLDHRDIYEYYVPNCMYAMVLNDPVIPIYLGLEQRGMQAGEELEAEKRVEAERVIREMLRHNLSHCDMLAELGLHKSIVNRYVEPWMWITVLMTSTAWQNFFRLRVHPAAERHFQKIAGMIRDAIRDSIPTQLRVGEWHLPYVDAAEISELAAEDRAIQKVSTGRCARVSYLTHDGKRDVREDIRLANQLIDPRTANLDDDVIHASPLEHVCQAMQDPDHRSGPFLGWHQFRKEFLRENVDDGFYDGPVREAL
jgi:hypothetical protein